MCPVSFLPIRSGLLPQIAMKRNGRHLSDEEGVSGCEDCVIITGTCSDQSSDAKDVTLTQVLEAFCPVENSGRWAVRSWGWVYILKHQVQLHPQLSRDKSFSLAHEAMGILNAHTCFIKWDQSTPTGHSQHQSSILSMPTASCLFL